MSVAARIRDKLTARFAPEELEVLDESHLHKGHPGSRPGGESHFRIRIVARAFESASRIERQRAIHSALKEELSGPVHALAITALAPEEIRA